MTAGLDLTTRNGVATRAELGEDGRLASPGPFLLEVRRDYRSGRARWWCPNGHGYTNDIMQAGQYDACSREVGRTIHSMKHDEEPSRYLVDARPALAAVRQHLRATHREQHYTPTLMRDPAAQKALLEDKGVQWVTRHLGRTLSMAEAALVVVMARAARCGVYDIQGWETRLRKYGGNAARFSYDRSFSTMDSDGLTRMVFQAHDFGARVSIDGCGGNRLEVRLHLRKYRYGEETDKGYRAGSMEGHYTIEDALFDWRQA
jgi:hypothetical protein